MEAIFDYLIKVIASVTNNLSYVVRRNLLLRGKD
jgi:hypothetical protein